MKNSGNPVPARSVDPVRAWELWLVCGAVAVLSCAAAAYYYLGQFNPPVIRSDGYGYYAYLTSIFFDHDLSFSTAQAYISAGKPWEQGNYGIGIHPATGLPFNKYTFGTAVLELPFFLVGHVAAIAFAYPASGYSDPYQVAVLAGGTVCLVAGSAFIFLSLRRMVPAGSAMLTVGLLVLATNALHYATYDSSFSHIYSFAVIAAFLHLLLGYRTLPGHAPRRAALLGLLLGLIILIRVPNAIIGLLAAGVLLEKLHRDRDVRKFMLSAVVMGLALAIVVSPLLAYWLHAGGALLGNSYQAFPIAEGEYEHFNWAQPKLFDFLFSVRKGLFFWTPVALIAFLALPAFVRRDRILGVLVACVLAMHVYVGASWWSWYFGGSFGSRTFVDMLPVMALPLSLAVSWAIGRWLLPALTAALLLVALNGVLTYAYWCQFIPYDGTLLRHLQGLPEAFAGAPTPLVDATFARQVELKVENVSVESRRVGVSLSVWNRSLQRFDPYSGTDRPVRLSWRFVPISLDGAPLREPGWDARLPLQWVVVDAGGNMQVQVESKLPRLPGRYEMQFSLVQEGHAWFHDLGMRTAAIPLVVETQ